MKTSEGTALERSESFESKMKDRIREAIGDLIPDEELAKMVRRGIDSVFFDSKQVLVGKGYNEKYEDRPGFMGALVKELLEEKVVSEAASYIEEHQDDIDKLVKDAITQGADNMVLWHDQDAVPVIPKRAGPFLDD